MKKYCGNQKPFIYIAYKEKSEFIEKIIKRIDEKNIALWYSDSFNKKEAKNIKASFALLIFVDKEFSRTEKFKQIIENAVYNNKNILIVYLEEVRLDSYLVMQVGSQQAIKAFGTDQEQQIDKILKASIFEGLKITSAQRRFQKNNALTLTTAAILTIALIFNFVLYPLLITPAIDANNIKKSIGLSGLTEEDLKGINEIHVIGNKVVPGETFCSFYEVDESTARGYYRMGDKEVDNGLYQIGNIEDISILAKLENISLVDLTAQKIIDISPLFNLKKVSKLILCCNPIKDINGIEKMDNLKHIDLNDCQIEDIEPLTKFNHTIDHLQLDGNRNIKNIELLKDIDTRELFIGGMNLSKLKTLGNRYYKVLQIGGSQYYNLDFISDCNIELLWMTPSSNNYFTTEKMPSVFKIRVEGNEDNTFLEMPKMDSLSYLEVSHEISSLIGIYDKYPNLIAVELQNVQVNDISELNKYEKLTVIIREDQRDLIKQITNENIKVTIG